MTDDPSPDLIERASHGDDAALEALVVRWLPDVERLVRDRSWRRLLERETPQDLAQSVCREALLRIRDGRVEHRGDAAFRSWLLGGVEWKLRDRWRRETAQRREGEPVAGGAGVDPDPAASQTSPSGFLLRAERRARFEALLARLDERSAAVVRAIQLEGRPTQEVAAEHGLTPAHCRTVLARALARLAGMVGAEEL